MDDLGFERWYRQQHPGLVSSLVVIAAGDVVMAAEAADEAFARAYANWGRVGRMASPGGWTYRTAVNVLRRRYRRARVEATLMVVQHEGGRAGAEVPAADVEWSAEIWDALRRLPTRERAAIALRYVADLPTEAIAYAMGVAPGTVGSTLHSARRRLAAVLSDEGDALAAPPDEIEEERSRA